MKIPVSLRAAACFIIAILSEARASVLVPDILGDHMVLQQQSKSVSCGGGELTGEKVNVTASWGKP